MLANKLTCEEILEICFSVNVILYYRFYMARLWHLSVFETPTHFYIVGSDVSKAHYRMLKIGRLGVQTLDVSEVGESYSKSDIMELLATVSEGSSSK